LLVIFFLQTLPQPVLPNLQEKSSTNYIEEDGYNVWFENPENMNWKSTNSDSVGHLLCKFFFFWWKFDYNKSIVSVRLGKEISKNNFQFPFYVEDPFETDFNCARLIKNKNLKEIILQFHLAYSKLIISKNLNQLIKKP